jgi:phosphatidylserine/phosphatidylglycerophosphate/cardiolipin synthase-like enzyme
MAAITDGSDTTPPAALFLNRAIFVHPDDGATFRIMIEQEAETSRFTNVGDEGGRFRARNNVTYFFGGNETFAAMVQAFKTVNAPDHFIYIAGWFLAFDINFTDGSKADFVLVPGDAGTSLRKMLKDAAAPKPDGPGAQVRLLLWANAHMAPDGPIFGQFHPHNEVEVKETNTFPGDAGAILDNKGPTFFSHHQKIVIVKGTQGLIAFCGGVDMNPDRVDDPSTAQVEGLYDVHCRIVGPSAADVLAVFVERWNDHPDHTAIDTKAGHRALLSGADPAHNGVPAEIKGAHHSVQTARTYNGDFKYGFAPQGKIEIFKQLVGAIKQANRFIYMENQYFTCVELAQALAKQLPNIKHLTILLQFWSDLKDAYRRTNTCLDILRKASGSSGKVRIFAHHDRYVHSKTWVIDDEFAIVGSANANRRGYTYDSECSISIDDRSSNDSATWRFAHRLRVRLWANMLNMDTPAGHAELADGVASSVHWLNLPTGSPVIDYQKNADALFASESKKSDPSAPAVSTFDTTWNTVIDPETGILTI